MFANLKLFTNDLPTSRLNKFHLHLIRSKCDRGLPTYFSAHKTQLHILNIVHHKAEWLTLRAHRLTLIVHLFHEASKL